MDDYEAIREHLYPDFEAAVAAARPWGELQARGEAVIWSSLEGFFWYPARCSASSHTCSPSSISPS